MLTHESCHDFKLIYSELTTESGYVNSWKDVHIYV